MNQRIWAIADLHLSFGVPDKNMDVFGPRWNDHTRKIDQQWRALINEQDLVLIPGDISWALKLEEVKPDLEWIGALPGTKVMIRGNHDYWWGSLSKLKTVLPSSCHLIQHNSFNWGEYTIGGARLWDAPGLDFSSAIDYQKNARASQIEKPDQGEEALKIYQRELGRLEMSLKTLNPKAKCRIAMTHYPPIGLNGEETEASRILEKYGVDICLFGHLHNVIKGDRPLFGEYRGIRYHLTACDYLDDFRPLLVKE